MTNETVLDVRDLVKQYDGASAPVFDGVSFTVEKGEVLVVLGPSGSGKSTLLRTIAGLEPLQGGEILLEGTSLETGGEKNQGRAARSSDLRTRIGMVFQSYDLFSNKTVLGNVTLAPHIVQHRDKADVEAEARQLLERVGLGDRAESWPHELSGGQRQRVAICRALILHPDVLLFDEVTAALDPEMVREVLNVIVELAKEGLTMIIVTHEMAFARAIADRVILIDSGKIVEESSDVDSFFEHPATQRAQQFLHTFDFEKVGAGKVNPATGEDKGEQK